MGKYMIFEGFIPDLEKKMARIGKKCAKYGVDFTYRQTGKDEYRDIKDDDGEICTLRYVEVEADGKAQVAGWEWLASVEATDKGNIITSRKDIEIPNRYYTSDCYCEHCNNNRYRRYLYLVQNTETGEIKQVGRSCLRDYTHGLNADMIASIQSFFTGLEEAEERPPQMSGFGAEYRYYDVEEVTKFMCETIRHFGYATRGTDGVWATADRAEAYLNAAAGNQRFFFPRDRFFEVKREMERVRFNPDSKEATTKAAAALTWIKDQDDSHSAWTHNLKVLVELGKIKSKHYPIMASLLPAYDKNLEREAERQAKAAAAAKSRYVGEAGERLTVEVKSGEVVTSWESEWGTVYMVKFISNDGNVFIWRASSLDSFPDDLNDVQTIKATVKGHDEYRGVKQTAITRCKLISTKPEEEPEPYNPAAENALNEAIAALS